MATTRIKDISKTTTDLASDTYGVFDGATNGTQKMARNDMYADWAAAYVAAPTTYKLAPLNSGTNKIDATYLPTSGDTPKGEWNASTNSPSLADGSGTAGDYYDVTTAGTQNLGSGSITFTVGDVVKYNGSTWFKIDSVANILDGSATAADGRSALSVNSKDEDAQANALKTTAPSMYFNGSSSVVTVADDDRLTFSSLTEFGKTTAGTWSPEDNTPALTDGTGTLDDHYKIDADGTVAQGGSTLSIIDGASVTAGQVVYYDGSVWRVKDCDDLPFSVSGWVNATDWTNFTIAAKYGSNTASREWLFYADNSDKLIMFLRDATNKFAILTCDDALTAYEGQFIHVCATYKGSGPGSANPFSSSASSGVMEVYINGILQTNVTRAATGYLGMSNTSVVLSIGRFSVSTYSKGSIRDVKIFNRELTADEVAELARGNDLGFADEWGDHTTDTVTDGGFEAWNTASDLTSWTDGSAVSVAQESSDVLTGTYSLKLTGGGSIGVTGNNWLWQGGAILNNKRYRAIVTAKRFSGSTDSFQVGVRYTEFLRFDGTTFSVYNGATLLSQTALGSGWYKAVIEFTAPMGTASELVLGVNGVTDPYLVDSVEVYQIGTLADFRSERFDSSTGKWYDLSDNAFVGTNSGATLVGREVPVYATDVWTPGLEFGGGTTGMTYSGQEGFYTRVGNQVTVHGVITLSAKGSSTGSARITGLPFTARNTSGSYMGGVVNFAANLAGVGGTPTCAIVDNDTDISLQDWSATGSANMDDTNFTDTSNIRFTVTYQIQ